MTLSDVGCKLAFERWLFVAQLVRHWRYRMSKSVYIRNRRSSLTIPHHMSRSTVVAAIEVVSSDLPFNVKTVVYSTRPLSLAEFALLADCA